MKILTKILYFIIFTFVVVSIIAKSENFDPEAVSQVSKGIAEWKLINVEKEQTQLEPMVYVTSSLGEMVESVSGKGVSTVKGLSAVIYYNQLPDPILLQDADFLNMVYKGNIWIKQDPNLGHVGVWDPINRTIWINPAKFADLKYGIGGTNLGNVLAHEMDHAKVDWFLMKNGKFSSNTYPTKILMEFSAIDADITFRKTLNAKFLNEAKIAQEIGMKNFDPIKSYKISEYRALQNIPIKKLPDIEKFSSYTTFKIGAINLPSIPSNTYFPPPNILFSPKTPFPTYMSNSEIPTYSPYSIFKTSTYTRNISLSTSVRKY